MLFDGEKPDKITRGARACNDDKVIFEYPLDKPGASFSRSRASSCMQVTCYEAQPYLADSKVGRSFREPQALGRNSMKLNHADCPSLGFQRTLRYALLDPERTHFLGLHAFNETVLDSALETEVRLLDRSSSAPL
jgi:hypothetical protein